MRACFNIPLGPAYVASAVEGLTCLNETIMRRARRPFPFLYKAGVRYQREAGTENWLNARELLKQKRGDCEDLSAYMAAWLRVYRDEPARVKVYRSGKKRLHAVVSVAGRILDPSRVLGMGRR